jgi:hypothetical protein
MSENAIIRRYKLTPLNALSFAFGNQEKRQFVVSGGDARQSCYYFLFLRR